MLNDLQYIYKFCITFKCVKHAKSARLFNSKCSLYSKSLQSSLQVGNLIIRAVLYSGKCIKSHPDTQSIKHHYALLVHRSLESIHAVLLPPSGETVHFPLGQWAHSRHAQSERENDCALFPLVLLGLLSALSVLILWPALCWAAPFI